MRSWQFFRRNSYYYWRLRQRWGPKFSSTPVLFTTGAVLIGGVLGIHRLHLTSGESNRQLFPPVMYAKQEVENVTADMGCKSIVERDYCRLKSWLENGSLDPNRKTNFGYALLHVAAIHGLSDYIQLLLDNGADMNLQDEFFIANSHSGISRTGMTIMEREMVAARLRDFAGLLKPMAKLSGSTALHYAVLADHVDVVKLLVEHGADPTLRNKLGHTPLDYINTDSTHFAKMRSLLLDSEKKYEEIKKQREKELRRKCNWNFTRDYLEKIIEFLIYMVLFLLRNDQFHWNRN